MTLLLPAFTGTPQPNQIYNTDALTFLRALPDNYVNCIVTSPPYYGLRNYGVEGQIGLEDTPQQFIETLVTLFREARRILRQDGTLWVNMGDSYTGSGKGGQSEAKRSDNWQPEYSNQGALYGLRPKNMLMMPARLAIALQDDGWILRSEIVWHKPNPMPESVADRPTKSHEMIYLLAKSERYYYDADAIREPQKQESLTRLKRGWNGNGDRGYPNGPQNHLKDYMGKSDDEIAALKGANKRSVWTVNTEPTPFAHFATFPQKLIEPMILAGCPSTVCACCGAPHERIVEREALEYNAKEGVSQRLRNAGATSGGVNKVTLGMTDKVRRETVGFQPTCTCQAETRAGIVLDPFMGSGTTALVARRLNRQYIGSELNIEYAEIARRRLAEAYTPMMQLFMETA